MKSRSRPTRRSITEGRIRELHGTRQEGYPKMEFDPHVRWTSKGVPNVSATLLTSKPATRAI